jgi:hypothetical protein
VIYCACFWIPVSLWWKEDLRIMKSSLPWLQTESRATCALLYNHWHSYTARENTVRVPRANQTQACSDFCIVLKQSWQQLLHSYGRFFKKGNQLHWGQLAAGQEIRRLLRNQNARCRFHKSPPLAPILCQMNAIHILTPYFPKIHFNITLPSTPRISMWSLPVRFFN